MWSRQYRCGFGDAFCGQYNIFKLFWGTNRYIKGALILQNVTMQEHVLPISLQSDDFGEELLEAPETLRELVENYKRKKLNFDKQHGKLDPVEDREKETSIFDHLTSNTFIFVMALILLLVTIIVIMLLFKGAKMWALITNLAMQKSVKGYWQKKRKIVLIMNIG